MCGIAGAMHLDGAPVDVDGLRRMTEALQHRGPDDDGLHLLSLRTGEGRACTTTSPPQRAQSAYECGLGFRRLSILDLSSAGHQPMTSRGGRVVLVFNGEIYNAFDLRPSLEADGFAFRSRTDTEVILALYERFGWDAMLERLNGMFALCLVDLDKGRMLLARDRLGIKPLYWYRRNDLFLFASEAKAFFEYPGFEARLDTGAVDEQLLFRYNAGSGFPLEGVEQLEPGCCLRIDGGNLRIERYWSIPDRRAENAMSPDEAQRGLERHLQASIRAQLISDVKLGSQLSGGIDSSLITAIAADSNDADLDAISIVFDDDTISEERWIRQAAARGGIDVHAFTMTTGYFFDNLLSAARAMDQPLNHPNALGVYFIAQCARDLVTVLLSGDGADELLGGYPRFAHAAFRPRIAPFLPLLRHLPRVGDRIWRRFGCAPGLDAVDWFIASSAQMTAPLLSALRPDADMAAVLGRRRAIFEEGGGDYLANCLRYELRTYLVDLLIRQDKMSMAHSIENRVPFLDHQLVEYARQIPARYSVGPSIGLRSSNARNTKKILKRIAQAYFDASFVYRPKSGFSMPLREYFCDRRFAELMEDRLLPGMRNRGIVSARTVRSWWQNAGTAHNDVIEALWIAASFELWASICDEMRQQSASRRS